MDELIEALLKQRNEKPANDFDEGWNAGLSCAIGIVEDLMNRTGDTYYYADGEIVRRIN